MFCYFFLHFFLDMENFTQKNQNYSQLKKINSLILYFLLFFLKLPNSWPPHTVLRESNASLTIKVTNFRHFYDFTVNWNQTQTTRKQYILIAEECMIVWRTQHFYGIIFLSFNQVDNIINIQSSDSADF